MASSAKDQDESAPSLSGLRLDDSESKPANKPAPKSAPKKPKTQDQQGTKKKKEKEKVVDSWEDEDVSSSEEEDGVKSHSSSRASSPARTPPPPQPRSPELGAGPMHGWTPGQDSTSTRSSAAAADGLPARRPEKTDAVARRMIAAGLGLKAPKQTDEQKAYQRSIREQEKKRREEERAAEQRRVEEVSRAKAAMWED